MSNLLRHAREELAAHSSASQAYDGMIGEAVIELLETFAKQGHSGASAAITLQIFERLARFRPLSPLSGKDDEWVEVGSYVFQNRRCSSVFCEVDKLTKEKHFYSIDGFIFEEPEGVRFTAHLASWLTIESFPFEPRPPVVIKLLPGEQAADARARYDREHAQAATPPTG